MLWWSCVCGSNDPTLIEFRMKGKLTLGLGVRAAQDSFRWFQQDTFSFLFHISSYAVHHFPISWHHALITDRWNRDEMR